MNILHKLIRNTTVATLALLTIGLLGTMELYGPWWLGLIALVPEVGAIMLSCWRPNRTH